MEGRASSIELIYEDYEQCDNDSFILGRTRHL